MESTLQSQNRPWRRCLIGKAAAFRWRVCYCYAGSSYSTTNLSWPDAQKCHSCARRVANLPQTNHVKRWASPQQHERVILTVGSPPQAALLRMRVLSARDVGGAMAGAALACVFAPLK